LGQSFCIVWERLGQLFYIVQKQLGQLFYILATQEVGYECVVPVIARGICRDNREVFCESCLSYARISDLVDCQDAASILIPTIKLS
jgi:hypothetical protein